MTTSHPSDEESRPVDDLHDRLRRAVDRLTELRNRPGIGLIERVRLSGKIEGVKLAASYLEESERIFPPVTEETRCVWASCRIKTPHTHAGYNPVGTRSENA